MRANSQEKAGSTKVRAPSGEGGLFSLFEPDQLGLTDPYSRTIVALWTR